MKKNKYQKVLDYLERTRSFGIDNTVYKEVHAEWLRSDSDNLRLFCIDRIKALNEEAKQTNQEN